MLRFVRLSWERQKFWNPEKTVCSQKFPLGKRMRSVKEIIGGTVAISIFGQKFAAMFPGS